MPASPPNTTPPPRTVPGDPVLMEQQLDRVEALAERGLDVTGELDRLRALVDRDKAVSFRTLLSDADRWATAA